MLAQCYQKVLSPAWNVKPHKEAIYDSVKFNIPEIQMLYHSKTFTNYTQFCVYFANGVESKCVYLSQCQQQIMIFSHTLVRGEEPSIPFCSNCK